MLCLPEHLNAGAETVDFGSVGSGTVCSFGVLVARHKGDSLPVVVIEAEVKGLDLVVAAANRTALGRAADAFVGIDLETVGLEEGVTDDRLEFVHFIGRA